MNEPKTFGELSLQDSIHWVNEEYKNGYAGISKIENDPDDRNRILIDFFQIEEPVSFPDNESSYEDPDTGIKYTTDKKQFDKWMVPFIEQEIEKKEKRIEEIKTEIQELKKSIPKS